MSVVQEFTVAPGQTEISFRLQKSSQHLLIKRISTLAVLTAGLMAGFPETVTAEISHPVRKRAAPLDRVPLADIAAWAQYGRGPIVEFATSAGFADAAFGKVDIGASLDSSPKRITTTVGYYLNDNGPVELMADDQMNITISGLVPGAKYIISAPEMPVMPAFASLFYQYQQSLILEGDRFKDILTKGFAGIIFPNDKTAIERIIITWLTDRETGATKECEYSLDELLDAQSAANPFFSLMSVKGATAAENKSIFSPAAEADLLVLDTQEIVSVNIHTVLGKRLRYTTVRLVDRNAL